jgi:hypothetical protein
LALALHQNRNVASAWRPIAEKVLREDIWRKFMIFFILVFFHLYIYERSVLPSNNNLGYCSSS